MIVFEVTINGQKIKSCGTENCSVLNVILNSVGFKSADDLGDLHLRMGGMTDSDEENVCYHLRFGEVPLKIGDEVSVRIIESNQADAPIKRYRSDRERKESPFTEEEILEFDKIEYERLKKIFEE